MRTSAQLFWSNVCIGSEDECWSYLGHLLPTGHGQFCVKGKRMGAHRFALSLYQDIPDDKLVCHKCDNPSCVNPRHLYVGTYSNNARDMIASSRFFHPDNAGQKHGMAKLTDRDIREIRALPLSQRKIAKMFNVSSSTVGSIKRGLRWRHVA